MEIFSLKNRFVALWISVLLSIIASLFLFICTKVFDISILGKWIDSLVFYIAIPILFGIYMITALCQDIYKSKRKQSIETIDDIDNESISVNPHSTIGKNNSINSHLFQKDNNELDQINEIVDTYERNEIINKQRLDDQVKVAIDYTIHFLTPYVTQSEMGKLLQYVDQFNSRNMNDIKVDNGITTIDLRVPDICNFTWGLMKIFEFGRGSEKRTFAAEFAKMVFPSITSNTQISTIRSKFRSEANLITIASVEEYLGIKAKLLI